jgi:hypothetical protein
MRVFDVLAWVVVALAMVKTIYYVVMLATGPARARRWLLLVPMVAVLVIDQVLNYRDRRSKAQPS